MQDKLFTLILVNFLNQLIMVEPVPSTDVSQIKGNEFRNFWGKTSTLFIHFICFINYVYYIEIPITDFDYLCVMGVVLGALLRLWAFKELGKYFTFNIGIQKDHTIIRTGPYKILSHPGYIGQFMVNVCTILLCNLHVCFLFPLLVYIIYRFRHRIAAEETMLVNHFKSEYILYKKSVLLF
jgi:protein-S-isoprenylcysteine O-methyltransferase Ste14